MSANCNAIFNPFWRNLSILRRENSPDLIPLAQWEKLPYPYRYSVIGDKILDYTKPILSQTTNLLDIFLYNHCHQQACTQSPESFYLWSAISMISACIQDKYYFCRFPNKRERPNLYILLVGPSGLGKDHVINDATSYIRSYWDALRVYDGKCSHAGFFDFLAKSIYNTKTKQKEFMPSKAYLITPELKYSVGGKGRLAADFISQMTALYNKEGESREATRMWGEHIIKEICINWIGGTTMDWLFETVDRSEIAGGYAARIVWVVESYDHSRLRPFYTTPYDYTEIQQYIAARIYALWAMPGCELSMTPQAREMFMHWFDHREIPLHDEMYIPSIYREPDMLIKLAIIMCISDGVDYTIHERHIIAAAQLVEHLRTQHLPKLINASYTNTSSVILRIIATYIQAQEPKQAAHVSLYKYLTNKGYERKQILEALSTLITIEQLVVAKDDTGKTFYVWRDSSTAGNKLTKILEGKACVSLGALIKSKKK